MKTDRFQKLALATTATTYLLVVAGAFVRAAGAGMGCPDWPRCFDRWIPPTRIEEVPARFADVFNVRLAWIEYVNRLIGSITGLLIFATLVLAWTDHRKSPRVLWSSVAAFVGVGLAGWLGKRVVDKHLDPSFVTVHMFVALVVVCSLVYATVCAATGERGGAPRDEASPSRRALASYAFASAGLLLVQVGLGTRVRADLERVARTFPGLARGEWITRVGLPDHLHRTLALVVTAAVLGTCAYALRKTEPHRALHGFARAVGLGVLVQVAAGVTLAYAALPPAFQVVHVALGSLLLGGTLTVGWLAVRVPNDR